MKYVQSQQRYQGDIIDVIVQYLEFCVKNEIYCRKHAVETIIVNKITKHVIGKELLTLYPICYALICLPTATTSVFENFQPPLFH